VTVNVRLPVTVTDKNNPSSFPQDLAEVVIGWRQFRPSNCLMPQELSLRLDQNSTITPARGIPRHKLCREKIQINSSLTSIYQTIVDFSFASEVFELLGGLLSAPLV